MATGAMVQVKIVVADRSDAINALIKLAPLNIPKPQVFLMPRACTREEHCAAAEWLVPFCSETGCRFGARLQTLLWNNAAGR
jgi:hypothetical protein